MHKRKHDYIKPDFHDWIKEGPPLARKTAIYKGDPERQNWICTGCKSTKSTLVWIDKDGKPKSRLNKYQAVTPTCAQKGGFDNRKYYTTDDIPPRHQVSDLINEIEEKRTRVLTKLLYLYAPRIGETIQLKKKDLVVRDDKLVLKRDIFKVPLTPLKEHPRKETKVPVKDSFCEEIQRWFKFTPGTEDYVFPRELYVFGQPEKVNYEKHLSREYAIKLVKDATGNSPHAYRHIRISHWAMICKTQFELMALTHHLSVSSLEKYIHLLPSSVDMEVG